MTDELRARIAELERGYTLSRLDSHPCPGCKYADGKFVESCKLHEDIAELEAKIEGMRETNRSYEGETMKLILDEALAALTIWTEAQGEIYDGKIAVGEIIRRRMAKRYSSDGTVAGTVARRYQFSAWNDDKGNNDLLIRALKLDDGDMVVRACIAAWRDSARSTLTGNALLYCNLSIAQPTWADPSKLVVKIGAHSFFRP